jgi:hypothetical protein
LCFWTILDEMYTPTSGVRRRLSGGVYQGESDDVIVLSLGRECCSSVATNGTLAMEHWRVMRWRFKFHGYDNNTIMKASKSHDERGARTRMLRCLDAIDTVSRYDNYYYLFDDVMVRLNKAERGISKRRKGGGG